MYIIGLTGTKGKTTTIDAICHILKKLDIKFCAYTTSFEMINGEKKDHSDKSAFLSKQSRSTMPGRAAVHKFIKKGYESGAKIAIIEATSVGLNQHRGDYIE
jgi:UDP-N-acetylmuramyl tripeptide synthase